MRIKHDGNVGINTPTPAEKLTVSGNQNITGKLAVGIANAHGSFDFYNQNTAYFNGAVTIDANLSISGGGSIHSTGDISTDGDLQVDTNAQIDGSLTMGGAINLGTADSSSGHINAYENMSFNIDVDNDDTNRYFSFHANGSDGSGTELMRLTEGGDFLVGRTSTSGVDTNGHVFIWKW